MYVSENGCLCIGVCTDVCVCVGVCIYCTHRHTNKGGSECEGGVRIQLVGDGRRRDRIVSAA